MARDDMDPQFSAAICRAYNDWLQDFCQHSPDQLRMAAMLPIHDVNLACQELNRCVKEMGAVGAFVRPNYVNGRYWHSNYWDPLYGLLQDLDIPLCFHGKRCLAEKSPPFLLPTTMPPATWGVRNQTVRAKRLFVKEDRVAEILVNIAAVALFRETGGIDSQLVH